MANKLSLKERAAMVGEGTLNIPTSTSPSTAAGMSGNLMAKAAELEKEIERLKGESGVKELPINKLHIDPKKKRNLTEDQRIELRENIRRNGLITPITVERRKDGEWDVLSGSNRVEIFAELEWPNIPSYERKSAEGEGTAIAFYANLLHPSLPDFEKYLGFKAIMTEKGISASQLAYESGLSKQTISKVLSFDKLPAEALDIIKAHPTAIGANVAQDLAVIAEEGGGERVVAAVKDVAFRGVTQSAALASAKRVESKPKPAAQVQSYVIKSGKSKFAEIRGVDSTLRIDFKDAQKREEFAVIIHDLIESIANKK